MLCEKPLANTVDEAEAMVDGGRTRPAARGQLAMVGFNYRRVPATALARRMVARAASAPCATSASPTSRTGSSTPTSRSPGG